MKIGDEVESGYDVLAILPWRERAMINYEDAWRKDGDISGIMTKLTLLAEKLKTHWY